LTRCLGCGLAFLAPALLPGGAAATTFTASCAGGVGDPASLKAAIASANAAIGPDAVSLGAGCAYVLTDVDSYWYGPDGLPPISSEVTIEGHGATIARAPGAQPFRLFFVGADPTDPDTPEYVSPGAGVLTLREVTLSGGHAKGGSSPKAGGGGGAGMGGAIFSQGEVVIERSTLTANTAQGGAGGFAATYPEATGGGGMGTDSTNYGGGFGPGTFGGGSGGSPFGGGAGFRVGENGAAGTSAQAGAGGGPRTGIGGSGGYHGGLGGDGSGGGMGTVAGYGGAFGQGGQGNGGGVGGGGAYGGGGGGFGGGGGPGYGTFPGGGGGFGGGGGGNVSPGGPVGAPGFGGGAPVGANGGGGAGMGGAIFNMQGELTVRSSTFAGNAAIGGADEVPDHGKGIGGAVFNLNGAFTAVGSTFASNSAAYFASQLYNLEYDGYDTRSATTTLRDTVVADGVGSPAWPFDLASNKSGYGITPPGASAASADLSQFNLVRTFATQEQGTLTGSPLTADPLLGPLSSNGGPTATMALPAGSPAIDTGGPQCLDLGGAPLTSDQRGNPRPVGAACDIGAYEYSPPAPPNQGPTATAPVLSNLKISPKRFKAAGGSGAQKGKRHGAKVSFRLSAAADVRFTVVRLIRRRGKKRPVKKLLRGAITRKGDAGANHFRFSGWLRGRALKTGRYRLHAAPAADGQTGITRAAAFRIVP
jgi:hypothetical protein